MAHVPGVMISSTFYDLQQVRSDLSEFFGKVMGFRPLVSELPTFPVDTDVSTVENCRRRVENEADLMVLLIGGRYGSRESSSSKSITNIEYLAARAKGIPIYAFVKSSVMATLPVWKRNSDADFTDVVDDPSVFEFVASVRETERVWTFEFELAQDVVRVMRVQLAYLFAQALQWQRRVYDEGNADVLSSLKGEALRIALEKPSPWEYSLFAAVIVNEVGVYRELRRMQQLKVITGAYAYVSLDGFEEWAKTRMAELSGLIASAEILLNEEFKLAVGEPGHEGDLNRIVFCGRGLGMIYRDAVEWTLGTQRTATPDEMRDVIASMYRFSDSLIGAIEQTGPRLKGLLEEMRLEVAEKGSSKRELYLTIDLPGSDDFRREIDRLVARLGRR